MREEGKKVSHLSFAKSQGGGFELLLTKPVLQDLEKGRDLGTHQGRHFGTMSASATSVAAGSAD